MSNFTRAGFMKAAGASALIPLTGGAAPLIGSRGILVRHSLLARPFIYPANTLAILARSGITAVSDRDGWTHYTNGAVYPTCNNPLISHTNVRPLDCGCGTNGNCYEPGGGDDQGYPVIGVVAVNYNSAGNGSTAVYTGNYGTGPNGTYNYSIPQRGFGPTYHFGKEAYECAGSIGAALKGVQSTLSAIASHASQFSGPIQKAVSVALENGGAEIATYEGAGEALAAIIAFATAPEMAVIIGFGLLTWATVGIVLTCF